MIQSKIIGLTGGIASGKSTVSEYLASKGIPIVDADLVSRQVVEPGSAGLSQIVEVFGQDILSDGRLNRKALRQLIFSDDKMRLKLNSILHPIIHDEILRQLDGYRGKHPIVVFDAPLLIENNLMSMVDELWVVSVEESLQVDRVMKRDHVSKEQAISIIDKQMSLEEKLKFAHVVLDNSKDMAYLYAQIEKHLEMTR
ncbi:dephospho-CoA kinase [Acidaminobacter sp. JC074]|uniref:dephospho-CoA kinase n=1 Tax=Acidaminobacter sp. JC074 TaxID=2530199 RepID=UPI001F1186A6|nr:dephospho-CoA kinase [Acidaminobacter sp. JC074]MCH4889450.1 dephospho-CoA kinase [Acidaminobacter sp. JC074]